MKSGGGAFLRRSAEELGLAMGLLTRLPLPYFKARTNASIATAFWAFPLAGALIGGLAAAAYWLATFIGFSAVASALLAMAMTLIAGGCFHEDGLSDFWDGLGGGRSREAKLAIMRDSRIGAYGALGLILTLALQTSFLVSLQHYAGAAMVMAGLIAAETAARGAIALPAACLKPARQDGLGASMKALSPSVFIVGVSFAIILPAVLLGGHAVFLLAGALAGAALITGLAWRFLGGHTGDVFGASAATARVCALAALVLAVTP